jgi:hypothetical protein
MIPKNFPGNGEKSWISVAYKIRKRIALPVSFGSTSFEANIRIQTTK